MSDLKQRFGELLNRHGYPFQYSALGHAVKLSVSVSPWEFVTSEFPVEVQRAATRIDFILSDKERGQYLLLVECKRVDPKYHDWCFVRLWEPLRSGAYGRFFADRIIYYALGGTTYPAPELLDWHMRDKLCHIGLAVKDPNVRGGSGGSDHDAIEKAATQVCRGLNGLVELMCKRTGLLRLRDENPDHKILIPCIFTTANLYVCDCELHAADLQSGEIDVSGATLKKEPHVFLQYHMSPGIKHSASVEQENPTFASTLDYEYVRTIPIVSANGIGSFLASFKPW